MKILLNCIGLKPIFYKKGGGAQKLAGYLILEIKDEHEIIIAGQMAEKKTGIKLTPVKKIPSVLTIEDFITNGISNLLQILEIEADIIFSTHERNFLPSFLYSKLKKKPMIAYETDHDFWVPPFVLVKELYHLLINQVDRVVAGSPTQKKRMLDRGIDPDKIILINNHTDVHQFTPNSRKIAKMPRYILNVSKFAERKNQLALLKAFKKLRDRNASKYSDIKLFLVGPGTGAFTAKHSLPSPYYLRCLEYILKHSLEQDVIIFENLEDKELIKLYRNATLFVFPSTEEGFGLTLVEAMACGCCCVANKIETSLDMIGKAGISVDVNNAIKLTKTIESLLENDSLRRKLASQARQRAVSKFGLRVAGKHFKALIKEVINEAQNG
jgi:glycosyltransferase involved in cell wall biosynthesis